MLKGMLALVTAALVAGIFVGVVPPPTPAVAKTEVSTPGNTVADRGTTNAAPAATQSSRCTQAWPYYEQGCLRDSRQPNSAARAVRVVARNK